MNEQTKAWLTLNEVREGLRTKPTWQDRALAILYSRQTEPEKIGQHTDTENGVGFSKSDAEILTSFHKQLIGINEHGVSVARRPLSARQREICAKHLPHYARQVWETHLARLSEQDRCAAISASHAEQLAEARQKRMQRKQAEVAEKMMPTLDQTPDLDGFFGARVRPGSLQHIAEALSRQADGWQEQGEYGCR